MSKIPLHKLISQHIKAHPGTRFYTWDIEKFGQVNSFNAYTARRRTQELLQREHRNYDPEIQGFTDEKGRYYICLPPQVIEWFTPQDQQSKLF